MHELTAVEVIASEWTLLTLTLILVCVRLRTRLYLRSKIWSWADAFVILAWLSSAGQCSMDTKLFQLGFFDHGSDEPYDLTVEMLKIFYVENATYWVTLYMVKFSMLCFFKPIIPPVLKKTYIAYWFVIIYTAVGFVVTLYMGFFSCLPISRNWSLREEDTCVISYGSGYPFIINYVFHFGSDAFIWTLPLLVIRYLKLSPREKIGVSILFGLGLLCITFAIAVYTSSLLSFGFKTTWLLCAFEQTWAVVVACASYLRPFWRRDLKPHIENSDNLKRKMKNRISFGAWSDPSFPKSTINASVVAIEDIEERDVESDISAMDLDKGASTEPIAAAKLVVN